MVSMIVDVQVALQHGDSHHTDRRHIDTSLPVSMTHTARAGQSYHIVAHIARRQAEKEKEKQQTYPIPHISLKVLLLRHTDANTPIFQESRGHLEVGRGDSGNDNVRDPQAFFQVERLG